MKTNEEETDSMLSLQDEMGPHETYHESGPPQDTEYSMMFDHPTHNSSFEENSQIMPILTRNIYPSSTRAPLASNSVFSSGNR